MMSGKMICGVGLGERRILPWVSAAFCGGSVDGGLNGAVERVLTGRGDPSGVLSRPVVQFSVNTGDFAPSSRPPGRPKPSTEPSRRKGVGQPRMDTNSHEWGWRLYPRISAVRRGLPRIGAEGGRTRT